jgi:hypothetical protein
MDRKIRTYNSNMTRNVLNGVVILAIIFFGLTLPLVVDGEPADKSRLVGLLGFWIIGLVVTAAPFCFKLEIGSDYVKTYFLGFCLSRLLKNPMARQAE